MIKIWGFNFKYLLLIVVIILSCQKLQEEKHVEMLETKLKFFPISEHVGLSEVEFSIVIDSNIGIPKAKLFYRYNDVWQNPIEMVSSDNSNYSCSIKNMKPGTVINYFIEITTATGTKMFLPKNAKTDNQYYSLAFRGDSSKILNQLSWLLLFISLVLFVIAAYIAFKHIKFNYSLKNVIWITLGAFILSCIKFIPVDIILNYQKFGVFWRGWPLTTGFLDIRYVLTLGYWFVVLYIVKDRIFSRKSDKKLDEKAFASLIIIGTVITLALYLLPHNNIIY